MWEPGEHNGTFRGFNPAFLTATVALDTYWRDEVFQKETLAKGDLIAERLDAIADEHAEAGATTRGRGMARGLVLPGEGDAKRVCAEAFERGLLMETSGPEDEVAKLLPPLTTSVTELEEGLDILAESVRAAIRTPQPA